MQNWLHQMLWKIITIKTINKEQLKKIKRFSVLLMFLLLFAVISPLTVNASSLDGSNRISIYSQYGLKPKEKNNGDPSSYLYTQGDFLLHGGKRTCGSNSWVANHKWKNKKDCLAQGGCNLFAHAHAIEWILGTHADKQLLIDLIGVCCGPSNNHGHKYCSHDPKINSFKAYKKYIESEYKISVHYYDNEHGKEKTAGWLREKFWDGYVFVIYKNGHYLLAVDYVICGKDGRIITETSKNTSGDIYIQIIDSAPSAGSKKSRFGNNLYEISSDGTRLIKKPISVNGDRCYSFTSIGKSYFVKVSSLNVCSSFHKSGVSWHQAMKLESLDSRYYYWKTASSSIQVYSSPFDTESKSIIPKGSPIIVIATAHDSSTGLDWYVTNRNEYIKKSEIGDIDTFNKKEIKGTGQEIASITTTVRPRNLTAGLYNEPYVSSIKMLTVKHTDSLTVKSVVINEASHYWLTVTYDNADYYICANMVEEYIAAPDEHEDVWIEGSWIAGADYPSGNYGTMTLQDAKAGKGSGIPLRGTIKSNYPIIQALGGWFHNSPFPLPVSYKDPSTNTSQMFLKTVPASGTFPVNTTRSIVIKDSNINTLNGRLLKAQGKGSYYYLLTVRYWKYKNVTSDSELPLQEAIWYSNMMPFTVGGGAPAEPTMGDTPTTVAVTGITLDKTDITLKIDGESKENYTLKATISPSNAANQEVEWSSSNNDIATVENGKVTAVAPGIATITATTADGGKTAACTVTVIKMVREVSISPDNVILYINGNKRATLTANIQPDDAGEHSVTWSSSDTSVASVDQQGVVTAKAVGKATITAKATDGSGRQGTCTIEVRAWVDLITLSGPNTVNAGAEIQLTAEVTPDNATDQNVTWDSSDTDIATVSAEGLIKGVKAGTVAIIVTAADRRVATGICEVTVLQPMSAITLSGENEMTVGDTLTILSSVSPTDVSDPTIEWSSSDSTVATVSDAGAVTALKAGKVTITAAAVDGSDVKAKHTIKVYPMAESIEISGSNLVAVDGTIILNAAVSPDTVRSQTVIWSSDHPEIASVDSQGVVTGLQAGIAVITASANDGSGVQAQFSIQVVKQKLVVKIEGARLVHSGSSTQLAATVSSDELLNDTSVTWTSSDPSVATIDQNGVLTGVSNGTVTITATSNKESYYSAQHQVTVDTLVSKITITGNPEMDAFGETQLSASVEPANATNISLIWSSSNPSVATVDFNGLVSGVHAGTATIYAKAADGSGVVGALNITVYPLPSAVIITGEAELLVDTTTQLAAEVLPAETRDKRVSWLSSDTTVATVNESGLITAQGNGTAVITATAAGNDSITATYKVTVITRVASVELIAPEKIDVGAMGTVIPTILPATASNKQLKWESDDESVAVVDASGNVFGISGGIATITATTMDGSEIVAEVDVPIFQAVQSISVDVEPVAYTGQTLYPYAIILPEDASETFITWESNNESVVSIEEYESDIEYELLAVCKQPGVARITATATDGSNTSGYAYIQVLPYTVLTRNSAAYTLYTDGNTKGAFGSISLTPECIARATEDKYGAVWAIEHISGDNAADIGIIERTDSYNGFSLTNSVDLKLLSVNKTGMDTYRITCTINGESASCTVTIKVEAPAAPLPESVSLSSDTFTAMVGDPITMDVTPMVSPAGSALPANANSFLYGVGAFNRYAQVNMGDDVFTVTFNKAGTYTAYVRYEGANYQYDAYANFVITTPEGAVPPEVEDLVINDAVMYMLPGESAQFDVEVYPTGADETILLWSSSNPDVVTVAADGTMTAVSAGTSVITVSADNGVKAVGFVAVTDSLLSIDWDSNNIIEVYVDGESSTVIQKVYLTPRASAQLTKAPTWTIKRQYGNNLTLICEPITATNGNGELLYGCAIILKSVSNVGITEYELTCNDGEYSASTTIQVNANSIENTLPSLVQWSNTTFSGKVNERVTIYPDVQCWPEGSTLPDAVIIDIEGDSYWNAALNKNDYTLSRGMITLSFSEPGVYTANCTYSCANMRYLVPITICIADNSGHVPVRLTKLTLNETEISIRAGDTDQLHIMYAPVDATNKDVTWSSDNPSVATVSANGVITGIANGRATITCRPADENCIPVQCTVVVEDTFTVNQYQEMDFQYLQGETGNPVAGFKLSSGTANRMEKEGLTPTWTLSRVSGNAANVELKEYNGVQYIIVRELCRGGMDTYQVTCEAGNYSWSGQATLEVHDLGITAPTSIKLNQTQYIASVGEEVELDFTPVCEPAGASIPSELEVNYIGIGEIYHNLENKYQFSLFNAGDKVKLAFKKPGTYLLSRQYISCNLVYLTECTIVVDEGPLNLLSCTDEEAVVYIGGKSSIASTCVIRDTSIEELYGDQLVWSAERLSGDCLTVALRADQSSASLYVVNAKEEGDEVWRVSCSFKGITDYVDIIIHAIQARSELPETVALFRTAFDGMVGNTIIVPLAVECSPEGTALPATDDNAWSFSADGNTKSHAIYSFENGQMKIVFSESGYYGGDLIYQSGNVSYRFPISFAIADEELILPDPMELKVSLSDELITVYPEGETNVAIVNAVLADSMEGYSLASVAAYAERNNAAWSVQILSGDACELSVNGLSAAAVQLILDNISHGGDVNYQIQCKVEDKTISSRGTIHVAADNEARPQPELKQSYFTTPTGTVLRIDASMYDRTHTFKLCSGKESIWNNSSALSAMGFEYETSDDLLLPVFYEPGSYTTTIVNKISNLTFSRELVIAVYTSRALPDSPSKLMFPIALRTIDAEAFEGVNANIIDLRNTAVTSIGERAFADIANLMRVYIPATVTDISADAFAECADFIICCDEGSYADMWAKSMKYPVVYSWE